MQPPIPVGFVKFPVAAFVTFPAALPPGLRRRACAPARH